MIVLDTHVLIWMVASPDRLSEAALGAIEMDGSPAISTISAQEISYLAMRGRIELDRPVAEWMADVLLEHEVGTIEPAVKTAVIAGSLSDDFPGDPADRLIYATAVDQSARLVSADRRLHAADPARIIW